MPPGREVPDSVLATMREDWNNRAKEDAYYYVGFAHPDQDTEVFQSTAAPIVAVIEAEFNRLPAPASQCKALEIGCGPGRLMLPLSRHFAEIHGVDVSNEMVARATQLLANAPNAHPHTGTGADLSMFEDDTFDFVYSYAVFQHIPSQAVVLKYLREIQRVLKPRGIFRGQFHGAPQSENPDTWAGCFFTEDELADFAAQRQLQLLALTGEGTQYLWATFRKLDPTVPADLSKTKIQAVTGAHGHSTVPQRGAYAAVSLWLTGLPDTCDCNGLSVSFPAPGAPVRPCYLGPVDPQGGAQLNAVMPKGVPVGPAKIILLHRGKPVSEGSIEVTPGPKPSPTICTVTDGLNRLAEFTVSSDAFKVILEDVDDPDDVYFQVDGRSALITHRNCLHRVRDQYYFTVMVPPGVRPGDRELRIQACGVELPPVCLHFV